MGVLVGAGIVVAASACQSSTGAEENRRVVGIIELSMAAPTLSRSVSAGPPERPAPLVLPDTVAAGAAFTATVTTTGPNGCWKASDVVRTAGEMQVTLTPYDLAPEPGAVCPQAAVVLARAVELRFERPGTAVVRVEGRKVSAGAPLADVFTSVERRVVVR